MATKPVVFLVAQFVEVVGFASGLSSRRRRVVVVRRENVGNEVRMVKNLFS